MRRCYLAFIVMFLLTANSLTAADNAISNNVTYVEKIQMDVNTPVISALHPTAKDLVIVWMTYSPTYKDAHIYYRCPRQLFDKGEAINTTAALLVDFARKRELRTNYRVFPFDEIYKEESKRDADGVQWCRYERHVQFYD